MNNFIIKFIIIFTANNFYLVCKPKIMTEIFAVNFTTAEAYFFKKLLWPRLSFSIIRNIYIRGYANSQTQLKGAINAHTNDLPDWAGFGKSGVVTLVNFQRKCLVNFQRNLTLCTSYPLI